MPRTPPGGRRTPTPEELDRERRALQLRQAGVDYDTIARQLGWANKSSAHRAVKRALSRVHSDEAAELRALEGARLETAVTKLWPAVIKGDTKAIETWLKVHDRTVELHGLAHRHGIADRQQALDAAMAVTLFRAVTASLEAAGLADEQRAQVLQTLRAQITATPHDDDVVDAELITDTDTEE